MTEAMENSEYEDGADDSVKKDLLIDEDEHLQQSKLEVKFPERKLCKVCKIGCPCSSATVHLTHSHQIPYTGSGGEAPPLKSLQLGTVKRGQGCPLYPVVTIRYSDLDRYLSHG